MTIMSTRLSVVTCVFINMINQHWWLVIGLRCSITLITSLVVTILLMGPFICRQPDIYVDVIVAHPITFLLCYCLYSISHEICTRFVVLCFVVVMQSFIMNSHEVFIHIHQGCFAGTGAIVRLPQCQWSKPDGYGKISQCITTTKHSKAKTACIFLGIYCRQDNTDRKSRRRFSWYFTIFK